MLHAINNSKLEEPAKYWKTWLKEQQKDLKSSFDKSGNTLSLLRKHSKSIDVLLKDLWKQLGINPSVCLIAVGGYGRKELFPYSDVDLLILIPDETDEKINNQIESMIGVFWDIGLAIGHSVRNLKECLEEAQKDVTVQTNLLESRWLIGNRQLYHEFEEEFSKIINIRDFFQAKMREQDLRHARFNDTAYNLEPNIKESPGGLRDLHNILWITRSLKLGEDWNALVRHDVITQNEMKQIRRHERHLQMLRIRLHYLANRREDRLIFDFQNELANDLGFVSNKQRRASEQLMHGFYRSAKFVGLMNEILLQLLKELIYTEQQETKAINQHFESHNGLLTAKSATLLQRNPSTILESFLLLEQHPELNGMSPKLIRTLYRVKNLVNGEFRNQPENKALFIKILKQPNRVNSVLNRMNRYGILGNYIPAFGRIVGQMQHDLFHVYTVDEHILNVLRNLHRFSVNEYAHEFPLCSKLFSEFYDHHLLYIAALFHDIAKGRGGDHSSLGTADASRFCRLHGLSKEDTELVSWLVKSHLIMSSTAQKSDLSDPQVIENFACLMGDERHLTALYLLTVADIRGTSPKVWNAWKSKLLENLFLSTRRLLNGNVTGADTELLLRKKQAVNILGYYGIKKEDYQPLWDKLGREYFLRYEGHEIAWHSRLLISHLNSEKPIVRSRLSPEGDGIQVLIFTKNKKDDLFARTCSFFERIAYTILEAKVYNTNDGHTLDSFLVYNHNDRNVSYRDLLSYIEYELTNALLMPTMSTVPYKGRLSRQVKHMPIAASVNISNNPVTKNYTLNIVAGDRPGLLSTLAQLFLKHKIHLQTAKINTLGQRAEDTFLISGKNGADLTQNTIEALSYELNEVL